MRTNRFTDVLRCHCIRIFQTKGWNTVTKFIWLYKSLWRTDIYPICRIQQVRHLQYFLNPHTHQGKIWFGLALKLTNHLFDFWFSRCSHIQEMFYLNSRLVDRLLEIYPFYLSWYYHVNVSFWELHPTLLWQMCQSRIPNTPGEMAIYDTHLTPASLRIHETYQYQGENLNQIFLSIQVDKINNIFD